MVDLYVAACAADKEPLTVTGLAIFLGFASRQSIYAYADNADFSYSVKRALLFVENGYERGLRTGAPTGPIFALKNMGWSDKQEFAHTSPDGSMSPKAAQPLDAATIRAIAKQLDDEC